MSEAQIGFGSEDFREAASASPQVVEDLVRFKQLLTDWGGRMNLVGPSALGEFWARHAWDSAQLFHVEQSVRVWADVGAGAGFPGVVLAILLKDVPGGRVHLIESMAKRVRFLEVVAGELGLPVEIHHARAEDVPPPPGLELVTARACAPFPRLLDYTQQFFRAGARGLFLKGRDVEKELTEARRTWTFQADLIPSRSDPAGRIVRIERLAPRGRHS